MTNLEEARALLSRGWAPVPVPPGRKGPVLEGWQTRRFTEEELPDYFKDEDNMGVLLGEPSQGLIDIDLDCGEAVALAERLLPHTGRISGRRSAHRSHRFYRVDPVLPSKRFQDPERARDNGRATIVEYRSTGSQTLVPPSRHPNGELYEWTEEGEPAYIDGKELFEAVSRLAAAVLLVRHWAEGRRQDLALALAGGLLRAGWSADDVVDFIGAIAEVAGDDEIDQRRKAVRDTANKLSDRQAVTGVPRFLELLPMTVGSRILDWLDVKGSAGTPVRDTGKASPDSSGWQAYDTPSGQFWDPPVPFYEVELPDFPVEHLPAWLRDYVRAEAIATQTPVDLAANLALAVLSTACARKVTVNVRPAWTEPINLYTVVALESGNRKSAVFSDMTRPLEEYESELIKAARIEITNAKTKQSILETRLNRIKSKAADANPTEQTSLEREATSIAQELEELVIPPSPRLLADDCTPEKLASLLAEQGGRIGVLSSEGDLFDIMGGRYSSERPRLGVFLKGHSGDQLRVDRMKREEFVIAPALTIGLSPQPDVLRGLVQKPGFRGRGLLARFLYSLPKSLLGRRASNPDPVPEDLIRAYNEKVKALASLATDTGSGRTPVQQIIEFSRDAVSRISDFEKWIEPKLADFGEFAGMKDWASKLAGAFVRISALLHFADHAGEDAPWNLPIQGETVEKAIAIGKYYIPHARAAFAEMGADAKVESAKYLLRWIEHTARSSFTKRDIFEGTKGRFKQVHELEPVLNLLIEHGFIREQEQPDRTGQRGRKPSPTYEVNPLWLPHYSQDSQNASSIEDLTEDSDYSANSANSASTDLGGDVLETEGEDREVFTV